MKRQLKKRCSYCGKNRVKYSVLNDDVIKCERCYFDEKYGRAKDYMRNIVLPGDMNIYPGRKYDIDADIDDCRWFDRQDEITRRIVCLSFYGYSQEEIAQKLHSVQGTISKKIAKIRKEINRPE